VPRKPSHKANGSTRKPSHDGEGRGPRDGEPRDGEGSARAVWTGSLGFGLVQVPVRLFARERPNELAFHQVDRRDHAPIGYERVNKETHEPVAWGDVAKAYEIEKGRLVIVTDEDFENANVEANHAIEIQDFVDAASIGSAYFERPYFVVPERRGEKAYGVLRDVVAKRNLAGVGLVVLRTRQHLCAVVAEGELLTLQILRFAHELRPAREVGGAGNAKATPREIQLAEQLVERMVVDWDPARYKDRYRDDLLDALRHKAETGELEPRHVPEEAEPRRAIDLVDLLQRSVAGARNTNAARSGRGGAARSPHGPQRAHTRKKRTTHVA
jgi:DNA end-binding protein Ku